MELLHKDDIKTLDLIINTCIKNHMVSVKELPDISDDELMKMGSNKETYYKRFFDIIKDSGKAEIMDNRYSNIIIYPLVEITQRFVNEGGFTKLYEDQLKKEAYEKIIEKGNIASATNSIWTKKTYWWTFGIAIAGFIISLVALYFAIRKT